MACSRVDIYCIHDLFNFTCYFTSGGTWTYPKLYCLDHVSDTVQRVRHVVRIKSHVLFMPSLLHVFEIPTFPSIYYCHVVLVFEKKPLPYFYDRLAIVKRLK